MSEGQRLAVRETEADERGPAFGKSGDWSWLHLCSLYGLLFAAYTGVQVMPCSCFRSLNSLEPISSCEGSYCSVGNPPDRLLRVSVRSHVPRNHFPTAEHSGCLVYLLGARNWFICSGLEKMRGRYLSKLSRHRGRHGGFPNMR